MSEIVHYKGKLRKVKVDNLEQFCKEKIIEFGYNPELPSYFNTYIDYLVDEEHKKYISINNELYEILEKEKFDTYNMFNSKKLKNGIIEYEVIYYNGGCGFEEAIERAIEKIYKEE